MTWERRINGPIPGKEKKKKKKQNVKECPLLPFQVTTKIES